MSQGVSGIRRRRGDALFNDLTLATVEDVCNDLNKDKGLHSIRYWWEGRQD